MLLLADHTLRMTSTPPDLPRATLQPGDKFLEYEIVGVLAVGGFAEVYEAYDPFMKRPLVIKLLKPSRAESEVSRLRNQAEAVLLCRLQHKNIVKVFAANILPDGKVWLALELLEGQTLREHLRERAPLAPDAALSIAAEIGDGVACAHEHRAIHRDLKPENVFITRGGEVKVIDFNTAKIIEDSLDLGMKTTEPGKAPGTPAYMAPEQCMGLRPTFAVDQYQLGLILYEMLAHHPFTEDGELPPPIALFGAQMHREPEPLTQFGVPDYIAGVVARMLAKAPHARFANMGEVVASIRAALRRYHSEHGDELGSIGGSTFGTRREHLQATRPRAPSVPSIPSAKVVTAAPAAAPIAAPVAGLAPYGHLDEVVKRLLREEDAPERPYRRASAVANLGVYARDHARYAEAVDTVAAALDEPFAGVRAACAIVLASWADPATRPPLVARRAVETHPDVRDALARAILAIERAQHREELAREQALRASSATDPREALDSRTDPLPRPSSGTPAPVTRSARRGTGGRASRRRAGGGVPWRLVVDALKLSALFGILPAALVTVLWVRVVAPHVRESAGATALPEVARMPEVPTLSPPPATAAEVVVPAPDATAPQAASPSPEPALPGAAARKSPHAAVATQATSTAAAAPPPEASAAPPAATHIPRPFGPPPAVSAPRRPSSAPKDIF
ncbi:MAG: protein kinase [Polyangiaceae bacterium]